MSVYIVLLIKATAARGKYCTGISKLYVSRDGERKQSGMQIMSGLCDLVVWQAQQKENNELHVTSEDLKRLLQICALRE